MGGYWLTGGHNTGRGAASPDVVLLLAGANDETVADCQATYPTLVNKLVTLLPNAH